MANPRQLALIFLISAAVIAILAIWVAWQRGELNQFFAGDPVTDVQVPFALPSQAP